MPWTWLTKNAKRGEGDDLRRKKIIMNEYWLEEWDRDKKKNWRYNREELGVCRINTEWREKSEKESRS